MKGYRGFPRPKPEGREKTSRRIALRYRCTVCKKIHQPPGIRTKKLEIPHPRLEKRNFVLVPFEEIFPETVHPVLNENIENLLKKSKDRSVVRLIKQ